MGVTFSLAHHLVCKKELSGRLFQALAAVVKLAQSIRRSTMVREVAGSNPGGAYSMLSWKIELS